MNKNIKKDIGWVIKISIFTFFMTVVISIFSETMLRNTDAILSSIILILIVTIGITSDIIGVAISVADPKSFHAMAAKKMKKGVIAGKILKNASKASNICNDVVGDIAGIVSGAAGAAIILKFSDRLSVSKLLLLSVVMTALVSCTTVGGKAIGKSYALAESKTIVENISGIIARIDDKLLFLDLTKRR